jgi:hypothetical protein
VDEVGKLLNSVMSKKEPPKKAAAQWAELKMKKLYIIV